MSKQSLRNHGLDQSQIKADSRRKKSLTGSYASVLGDADNFSQVRHIFVV